MAAAQPIRTVTISRSTWTVTGPLRLASLMDCHGTASAAAFAYREQGRRMGDGFAPIRFVTASLKLDFKRPTPLGTELVIVGALPLWMAVRP